MRIVVGWAVLVLGVLAVLGIAHEPLFWVHYALTRIHGTHLPLFYYEPRELVPGGNEPPPPRESPASESLDIGALEAAAAYAGAHHSRALIISRHGYLIYERYWHGSRFDTLIESGPLGRVLAALVTGNAIYGRRIGWPDAPIGMFLSEWQDDPRGSITVRNLLQSSSGLAVPPPAANPWSAAADQAYGSHVIAGYLQRSLQSPPGQKWVQQSVDPDLLVLVIQKATHERYAQYLSRTLWRRIGAADAWLWLDRPEGDVHVDRGFLARQGDWLRVAELLLQNGRYQGSEVIDPRWVPQLLRPAKANADYGAYIRLGAHTLPGMTAYDAPDLFLVQGGGSYLWLIPSLQLAVLRTGEAPPAEQAGRTASDDSAWDEARIPNLVLHGTRDFVPAARSGAGISNIVPNH
ncbi:MAG TPA: serine hydrolase [Steroidobacteraceae bacterium]|nr:serine hydrolase [Steroidobacteraceae bacterium]